MAKGFDPALLSSILVEYIESTIASKSNLVATQAASVETKEIQHYEGRMRISGIEKFNVPAHVGIINFYLNAADQQKHKAKGALVVYLNIELSDKIYKAFGYNVPYDEDDESMMKLCGQMTQELADKLKEKISAAGYVDLILSTPAVYRNTISSGVEFSPDQKERQELGFYFFKQKAIAIDITLAELPKK